MSVEGNLVTCIYSNPAFIICHAVFVPFEKVWLGAFFECRQLGFRHRFVKKSDDIELLEFVSPAEFATTRESMPEHGVAQ
ncbi:hypothetical protein [Halocynthiibacter namhaensis]|uniref:hypothetical protein n=1 Tax=Halocynthiibacter namhaensis TaxID=1290553 RepID=UPI0012E05DC7|nr:hypothetical protein [Halocynthiibacter namhaensis]